MPYRINVDARAANHDQLKAELEALAILGIRTFSVIGRDGEVAGVYLWSDVQTNGDPVPAGEYRHIDEPGYEVALSDADVQRIKDAVAAHVAKGPPNPSDFLLATMVTLGQGRARQLMRAYPDVVRLLDGGRYWAAARQGLADAFAAGDMSQQEYDTIQTLLAQFNIPTENAAS